jgi:15-cis-phytoene synthase
VNVETAYRYCETVTRREARNFSYGIRLLPPPRRRALSAVYAFARRVDDIGDGDLPADKKLEELAHARQQVREVANRRDDPVLVALAHAARRLPIPLAAFEELVDGCEADVRGTTYATFDEVVHYCRCVAGSIGRLSLGVFDTTDRAAATPLADALGVALQLTNILRDVQEDADRGRLYLPREFLDAAEVPHDPQAALRAPGLPRVCERVAAMAHEHFRAAQTAMRQCDAKAMKPARLMGATYAAILSRLERRGWSRLAERVSLPAWQKLWLALRHGLF